MIVEVELRAEFLVGSTAIRMREIYFQNCHPRSKSEHVQVGLQAADSGMVEMEADSGMVEMKADSGMVEMEADSGMVEMEADSHPALQREFTINSLIS